MNEELIAKAKEAKSAEELLSLAKENNYPLTEEEAQNYFNQFHTTGELSDDELDQVGGGCGGSDEPTTLIRSDGEYDIIKDVYQTCVNGNFDPRSNTGYSMDLMMSMRQCRHCTFCRYIANTQGEGQITYCYVSKR